MYMNSPYVAQQIAEQYTRDRIRAAEAGRAAREARGAARETRAVESSVRRTSATPRPWWAIARRVSTAVSGG